MSVATPTPLPKILSGPRVERRRVLVGGTACWGTLDEGASALRLDDGRSVAVNAVQHLAPCEPTKIICVHLSKGGRAFIKRAPARGAAD